MKKLMVFMLILVLVLGATSVVYGAGYSDIKSSNWAYEAVNAMSDRAIISGYPDGSFKPNSTITTGEFIKMALIAATGEDVGNSTSGNWATNYYNKALELKYFTQYDIAKENLNKQITRAHMALIISSILGDVKINNYDEIQKGITDITYKTPYEYDITKSYASGILTGYTDETFKPDKTLSRAEAATVIYRLVDESKRILPHGEVPESSKKPIDEVITNYKSFLCDDGSVDDNLAKISAYEYEIVDYSSYDITLKEVNGIKSIYLPNTIIHGIHYLIKNNKVIECLLPVPNKDGSVEVIYESDISTVDYIGILDGDYNMTLIKNPFKK